MSLAGHLMVFAAFFWPSAAPLPDARPSTIFADLVEVAESGPAGPPETTQVKASDPQVRAESQPPVAAPAPEPTDDTAPSPNFSPTFSDVLSESQLMEAMSANDDAAGGGASATGGACDTARAVQHALQRDPLVHTAVAGADRLGKAVMLWNGDWVRSGEQDGKGLSAVREAIMWEVAFAPESCRNKQMRGPVLLSLADGTTRFLIGLSDWRWSDLLGLRERPANR